MLIPLPSRIINLAREDAKGVEAMGLKLMEEVGELAEAINFHQGYLPHKTMKEPLIGEAADVIQNVLAILARIYEDKSPDEILGELEEHLQKKTDKWESIMIKAEDHKVP
jgi:NTP pyrophosphatase (non-canonical NTP hydrolase)